MKYIFRGNEILNYDPPNFERNGGRGRLTVNGDNFNNCQFIDEDYLLLANYFYTIYRIRAGIPVKRSDLNDVIV